MQQFSKPQQANFSAIALRIASPEQIRSWSSGEVTKPETINYRTQKPELDGLFCARIFGPTKNWECYCGKYKRIRYKGVVCEKCGVEVTRSVVRRERMGHISLAVPVTHVWYLRSTPSRIGLLLDKPVKPLEQVVYFASYIIISVDQKAKEESLEQLDADYKKYKKQAQDEAGKEINKMKALLRDKKIKQKDLDKFEAEQATKLEELNNVHSEAKKDLQSLEEGNILSEIEYRELNMKFGHVFTAGTGAESLRIILEKVDLDKEIQILEKQKKTAVGQRQKKIMKRIRLMLSLKKAEIRPEWTIMAELPIIPPDLRPMVQLDGGRFAASDLNDLYRRIINRNNRLKRLMSIGAPEVICRNEKRMLQEAVDTLINNSPRAGRAVFTAGERKKLRSLSDMLKGKQGRFRQNLLGKRVDYSGRSVIVVGPQLKLNQCGLPKKMAMKLFKPFVIGELIRQEYAYNVKGAERFINSDKKVVWDILEEITKDKYVLLNRAPTLHRLGIQAFAPTLIEGKAIQIHPLVCAAFNADFDGDQMAVHLPLSDEAQWEAREIIASNKNLLKPSSGGPIVSPTLDMVLGCYFLTQMHEGKQGEGMVFADLSEAINAYRMGIVDLQAKVKIRINGEIRETTVGRGIFNSFVPKQMPYQNETMRKKALENLLSDIFATTDTDTTARFADQVKRIGFKFATKSGLSIAASDMLIPGKKEEIINEADEKVRRINNQYWKGFITEHERYMHAINIWSETKTSITNVMVDQFKEQEENDIFYTVDSGARGNWGQITQLCGMKGLVANPGGKTIELPIKSNLKEGFTILEYFIATHGGRKGKSDTALKTAEAGYLTRRLVDAVQDIIIKEQDCGSTHEHIINRAESKTIGERFAKRIFGRTLSSDLIDSKTGEVIGVRNDMIGKDLLAEIEARQIAEVKVRSVMTCQTENGICQKCYGFDLGSNKEVEIGTPVGIIAAQSIGEPGTQLTMRTFHMGGVAEGTDITQGLTRVEELFEARAPKTPATLSEINGKLSIEHVENETIVHIFAENLEIDTYQADYNAKILVKEGDKVTQNQILIKGQSITRAKNPGIIKEIIDNDKVLVKHSEYAKKDYTFKPGETLLVEDGQYVKKGDPLNAGHFNLRDLLEMTETYTVQKYLMSEVQTIYASQGQTINDKHIEIIVKQMFSKVRIIDPRDVEELLPGEVVDIQKIIKLNQGKGRPAIYERLLLGLTRIALATESWLSAASFQETIRVLVEASTTGKIDELEGLKENVIIGRLIPAGHIYRKKFYEKQAEEQ